MHSQLEERHQFRLLELHPGSPGDTIKATLVTKDLRDAPYYEAMSYVWGDMDDRVDILVDDRNFKITKNLHDALENLKLPTSIRILWTDQVCIDQYHNTEKQDQVHMMDEIYKAADGVIVYLGQSTEQTEIDMQHLQSFMERYGQREERPWSHIAVPELEQSVSRILTRPWFGRMWTVQEAVLARRITLQCGRHKIRWTCDLGTLRALVFRIKAAVVSPIYNLHRRDESELDWTPLLYILESQMRQAARREYFILQRNLLDVAFDFRHRRSTMLHDMYYAILGIVESDQGGKLLDVQYNIPAEEVYERFRAAVQRISEIEDVPLA